MGNHISLIHLPAQSGKTRKMTELINKWNSLVDEFSGSDATGNEMNIIFTSNTKLLSKQTANRIHVEVDIDQPLSSETSTPSDDVSVSDISDISSYDDDDSLSVNIDMDITTPANKTIAWVHGKKTLSVSDVFAKVTSDDDDYEINNIICCSNKARMRHAFKLIEMLNKKYMRGNFKKSINIWIDEADASIRLWNEYINMFNPMTENRFVKNIVLVSATMTPVYKHLHEKGIEPNLRTYQNTHSPNYHKYTDSELRHELSDKAHNVDEQLRSILASNSDMVIAGSKWFCPGSKNKKSHEQHCTVLCEFGFNVLILNGANKEFRMNDGRIIPISEQLDTDLEIAKTLNRMYYSYDMQSSPFAVTGNICVSRGITFASKINDNEFLFTHAVIPDTTNSEDAYQMVSRCNGNIRDFVSYKSPIIFVSTKTSDIIKKQEDMAVSFAKKYWKDEDSTVKITSDMMLSDENIRTINKPKKSKPRADPADKDYRLFDNQTDAIEFAQKTLGVKKTKRCSNDAPKTLQKDGINPTVEYLLDRMWGVDTTTLARMVPTNENKWCVYWRPSLINLE
jgi:hypothetical protein